MSGELHYPFDGRPGDGEVMRVAPGILWVRMPIPIPGLDYINLWLIEDGDGWTMVDTGLRSRQITELWEGIFTRELGGKPITRIICTHFHPDHLGQAGAMAERWNARLWMTLGEWSFGRMLYLDSIPDVPEEIIDFYRRSGFDEAQIERIRSRGYNTMQKALTPIPRSFRRIVHGERFAIGEHEWEVIVGRGHSPEHACLYCPALNVMISGDQVLPKITPHLGVYANEPDSNPLKFYLASLAHFRHLPVDTLILPAHNDPFTGLHARLDQMQDHHDVRLTRMAAGMAEPATVFDVLPLLFTRTLNPDSMFMAVGEALAHLHYLVSEGRAERITDADGIYRYRLLAEAAAAAAE